jgi:hypothetical protein
MAHRSRLVPAALAATAILAACKGGAPKVAGSGGATTTTTSSSGGGTTASGGAATTGADGGDAGEAQDAGYVNPDAFYVATNGDDQNPGTLAQPFATLGQAQKAMRGSATIKTTYVRAGTYQPPVAGGGCLFGNAAGSSIELTSADQGETWSYYPPDGFGSAILDGQSTQGNSGGTGGNGAGCGFGLNQVQGVTITGLAFERYLYAAVWGYAAKGAQITDNVVHDITAAASATAGLYLIASPGALVANNVVHDVAYMGIAVADNSNPAVGMSDSTIAGNVVMNACTWPAVSGGGNDQNGGDCGGIYLWSQYVSTATNVRVTSNYVRDVNPASHGQGDFGSCCAAGIYLDDRTSDVAVSGNVVTGVTSSCFLIHGGQDNVLTGNLCDLGTSGTEAIIFYQNDSSTQMTGNVFQGNVVVADSSAGGGGYRGSKTPPNPLTIKDNAYFDYGGALLVTSGQGGAGSDASPVNVDPQISCWAPQIKSGSPVLAAPVSFPALPGGWGYPGFVLPQTGTPPSWPHGC